MDLSCAKTLHMVLLLLLRGVTTTTYGAGGSSRQGGGWMTPHDPLTREIPITKARRHQQGLVCCFA
ncbi:MAG TPA: hypothetical protein QF700_06830 [Prochlorococcus sp.]|nr:hypothetical protein [Prochlorococcus sp.]